MVVRVKQPRLDELPRPAAPWESLLRLWRGLRQVWDLLEEAQREVERHNGGHPVCVERCGLCCTRSLPIVSRLEVSYIVGQLPGGKQGEEVRRRALRWLTTPNPRLQAQGLPQRTQLSPEQLAQLQADNAVLQEGPCPFLGERLECLIHDVRPLVCRSYGVTLPADPWCPRPLFGIETANARHSVPMDTPLGEKIAAVLRATWRAMKFFGREDLAEIGPLPTLMAEALEGEAKVKELQAAGQIQDAKLGKGRWVLPDIFGQERYGL